MDEKEVIDAIGKYNKLSSDQLMTAFVQEMAKQQAKDGGASMNETIERIKPLLNTAQQKRLDEILRNAKK